MIQVRAEIGEYVVERRGAHPPEAVRRGRRDTVVEGGEERAGDRLIRHTKPHRRRAPGDLARHLWRGPAHQGERTRPARARKLLGDGRDVGGEPADAVHIGEVHNHGVGRRPTLDRVQAPDGHRIASGGAEPVDRLGREHDQPATAEGVRSRVDLCRSVSHMAILPHPGNRPRAGPVEPCVRRPLPRGRRATLGR